MRRDKEGNPYALYNDVWDLAINPADNIADKMPFGKTAVQNWISDAQQFNLTSSLQNLIPYGKQLIPSYKLNNVKGKPWTLYGRIPITKADSIKYSNTPYKPLPNDQNTHDDHE